MSTIKRVGLRFSVIGIRTVSPSYLMIALLVSWLPQLYSGEWQFVDMKGVVNRSIEDDGIAGNGKGGWSDEGINDMYVYPPVGTGVVERNNHRFSLIGPATNGGKAVVMLRGSRAKIELPGAVTVPLNGMKGKFVYVLQNSVLGLNRQKPNYRVATYTVTYEDGSTIDIPIRDRIEIQPWWTRNWWENQGKASWPFNVGVNVYSLKWKSNIGLWSMQWTNPHPKKAIKSITLASTGKAVPVIWAISISDIDAFADKAKVKEHFKRPAAPPAGYFRPKLDLEREGLVKAATAEGRLKGIRHVRLIRNDVLAVTIDGAMAGVGSGSGAGILEAYDKPSTFAVTSTGDGAYKKAQQPRAVGRLSTHQWVGDIGPIPAVQLFNHTYYLQLPKPMQSGQAYQVHAKGLGKVYRSSMSFAYDEARTETPALKVNQVGYFGKAKKRYAYLGWWAGSLGTIDYSMHKLYRVVDSRGTEVYRGAIRLRRKSDSLSGEDVYEMDLSPIQSAGRYRIQVKGLGVSSWFRIGSEASRELYYHTMRAFFHQRCGCELKKEHTSFPRKACHLQAYEGGYLVGNPGYAPRSNEAVRVFRGGYHDAGDHDCFTYHLRATVQTLVVYEAMHESFKDGDLNIPESGNGIPDVLDEADYALFFYRDHQREDGAVPLGRGNDQDYISKKNWGKGGRPKFGILPPSNTTCTEYAVAAAQFARLIKPYSTKRASSYLKSARRAYAWAMKNSGPKTNDREPVKLFQAWAAAELFRTTGEERYNKDFLRLYQEKAVDRVHWSLASLRTPIRYSYAACKRDGVDQTVQEACKRAVLGSAKNKQSSTYKPAYRMGAGERGGGWGSINGGGYHGYDPLLAYFLSRDEAHLTTASLNADYQLGANPLSRCFITGMGARPPVQPQLNPLLYSKPKKTGTTVKGISIYGPSGHLKDGKSTTAKGWYPGAVPGWRLYRDLGAGCEINSEFTITETIGNAAALYMALHALSR